jgi:hypothetical protein
MSRFITVHPTAFKEDDLRAFAARKGELPSVLRWHSCFVATSDHVAYGDWEAPDGQMLAEVFEAYGIPFEAIHEVRCFDPTLALLEAA